MKIAKIKPQPDSRITFLRGFLRNPQQVGSVIPSSRFLERRLVRRMDLASARVVVELGPGTGGVTRAMLRELGPDARLLAIERDPSFVRVLGEHADPRLIPHLGSAEDIRLALAKHGLDAPDVVISGIPFSTMPKPVGRRILEEVRSSLAPGGCFVAYQFRDRVAVLGREVFGRPQVAMEMRNIPPMRVYSWRKPESQAA
ncbi:MAG: methyltransferase domain-containing protein [Myxococcota bacterium]|nr:methyltransferase domain-containing protein [Myxococcota bacterium]